MDMDKLARAFSEAANLTTTRTRRNDAGSSRETLPKFQPAARPTNDKIHVMPCFYIYPLDEKLSKNVTNKRSKASLLSIQECDYTLEDQSNRETYEEENYEYDRALSADRTYLKLKKRVDAYPEQCFRYSYGGKPLLPSEEMENPRTCNLCGGQRHYELQLMTPLIHFLQAPTTSRGHP